MRKTRTLLAALAVATALILTAAPALAVTPATGATTYSCAIQFRVTAAKYYNEYGYSTNHYNYTQDDVKTLATVIYLEARGEPYECKIAVANVVMNRVLASGYPGETIKSVVSAPNQFCYDPKVSPDTACMRAALDVLKYEMWTVPQNCYFFRATTSKTNWGSNKFYKLIGHTAFYLANYAGRSTVSSVPQRLYKRTYQWPQYGCAVSQNVKKVQIMLNALGYKSVADGWFGQSTRTALIAFQKKYGLTQDGVAGPATLKKLISVYGLSRYLKL